MAHTPLLLLLSVLSISSIANAGFKFGGLTINQVNTQLESLLLPQINSLRSSAHPAPDTPLAPLVWDANLAKSAGQWASKCIIEDNSDDYYSGKVGESITQIKIRDFVKNLIRAADGITLWAAQNATYDYTSDNCFQGDEPHSCADYRQLLWDTTQKIGCATNICKKEATLVCQYFPPGDAPGVRPFKSSAQDLTALSIDFNTGNLTRVDVEESDAAPPSSKRAVVRGTNNYGDSCKPVQTLPLGECTLYNTCAQTQGRKAYWGAAICGGGDNVICCIRDTDYVPNNPNPTTKPTTRPTTRPTQAPATPAPATPAPGTPAPATPAPATPAPATPAPATPAPATPAPATPSPTTKPTNAPAPTPTTAPQRLTLPAGSYNWRGTQAVTPIKDQGQCGSCWAFSSSAAAESAWAIKTGGAQIDLAEQRLVDCVTKSHGCNGGSAAYAFPYLVANGGVPETSDAYTGSQGTCDSIPSSVGGWAGWTRMSDNSDDAIKAALLKYGPMVVYVNADEIWQSYRGGVISKSYTSINHAVLLVGYDPSENAWIIKNSWNTWWGDKGYVHVDVNGNFGMKVEGPYYITA